MLTKIQAKLMPHKQNIFLALLLILTFILSTTGTYFILSLTQRQKQNVNEPSEEMLVSKREGNPNVYNVLLLGYGGAGHSGGTLSDVLMLISIDTEKKHVYLISVPRDTWVELPVRSDIKEPDKINASFAIGLDDKKYPLKEPQYKGIHGGGNMAKAAVETVTGIQADNYVAVSFREFEKAVDLLGGLDVNVPQTFDDYFYPIVGKENESCGKSGDEISAVSATMSGFLLEKQFECRYEHLHFDRGSVHMDGTAALKFVRSRHSDQHGGDFARSERQQTILFAVMDKLISMDAVSKHAELYDQFKSVITTDITKGDVKEFVTKMGDPKDYQIRPINLTTENVFHESTSSNGQYILIPKAGIENWQEIHQFIDTEIKK